VLKEAESTFAPLFPLPNVTHAGLSLRNTKLVWTQPGVVVVFAAVALNGLKPHVPERKRESDPSAAAGLLLVQRRC